MRVFERIKLIKPSKLYIAADGPRVGCKGEARICKELRDDVIGQIDWQCKIETLFRTENLGCRLAVSGAINWFFENEEEGIILEDDCLPDMSFFHFCEEMLERYRNQDRVFHISGCNLGTQQSDGKSSYYFSRFVNIWGWATWKRAWKNYDVEMKQFLYYKDKKIIEKSIDDEYLGKRLVYILSQVYRKPTTWDYQWLFSVYSHGGLAITPRTNMISNIGFGKLSTHASFSNTPLANLNAAPIGEIIHPSTMNVEHLADLDYLRLSTKPGPVIPRVINKVKKKFRIV